MRTLTLTLSLAILAIGMTASGCDNTVSQVDKAIDNSDDMSEEEAKEKMADIFDENSIFRVCQDECLHAVLLRTVFREIDKGNISQGEAVLGLGFLTSDWPEESNCHEDLRFHHQFETMEATPMSENGVEAIERMSKEAIKTCAKPAN